MRWRRSPALPANPARLGARAGADITQRVHNLVVTNVPGPQTPLYVGEPRMVAAYPVVAP